MPNKLLTKDHINDCLYKHYRDFYGEQDSDIWYEQPATNVWVFSRNGKVITLKCHILTGKITAQTEEYPISKSNTP